jgi:PBSX family phage terminase large subunit
LRGHNLAVQDMSDPEICLVGAAGTGKTLGILKKINRLMWEYPKARCLIVRKVRADLAQSTLVTYERDVLGQDNPICSGVQREYRQVYRYPNGSEVVVGGMDRPGKILSAEYDIIYAAEAVQFTEEDWETFSMRLRNDVIPFQQLIADTNPDNPEHWLKQRGDTGKTKLLNTYHKDNPAYWDNKTNNWTPRGEKYVLGKLSKMSGHRRQRYYDGKWAAAEGAIYDGYDEDIHVIDAMPQGWQQWRKIRSIDFGYTNPFVCQWWAIDGDGRAYLYREIYLTRRIVEDHAKDILRLSEGEKIEATVTDHDAEDRATLERYGIKTIAANKAVSVGIQEVQSRLRVQDDNKPRLFFLRETLVEQEPDLDDHEQPMHTRREIPAYIWNDKIKKEEPVKENDHGCDAMRYGMMYLAAPVTPSATTVSSSNLYKSRNEPRRDKPRR